MKHNGNKVWCELDEYTLRLYTSCKVCDFSNLGIWLESLPS
jgi:hypothetical protein